MQIHKAVGHKDVRSKDLAVRTAGAVHKELVGHIGHILLGADHHYTSDLGVWGCPIDLLVSKDFHIGHIGGTVEHRTLEGEVLASDQEALAFDHSSPSRDYRNLLAEVGPRFFFEVVVVVADAPAVVALPQLCRKAVDPWGCVAVTVVVVVAAAAGIEKDSEDSEEMFASFSGFEIAELLVSVCQFEAHVGSHSLLKRFWCTGQCSYSGQHCRWEDQVEPCFFLRASLIEWQMYREHLALHHPDHPSLSAYSSPSPFSFSLLLFFFFVLLTSSEHCLTYHSFHLSCLPYLDNLFDSAVAPMISLVSLSYSPSPYHSYA